MPIIVPEIAKNANGGTEQMTRRLEQSVDKDLLDQFVIYPGRVDQPIDPTKRNIIIVHDLPHDPALKAVLDNGGWNRFQRIIFVSNWQMQMFIFAYQIPWEKCLVIPNGTDVPNGLKKLSERASPIKIGYWSTPHRGLEILIPVFEQLAEIYDIELHVYSSFNLYGWAERDQPYQPLFDRMEDHPKIFSYGTTDNHIIREQIKDMHILGYPSIWQETSCLVMMEAMMAGLLCVHSNLGALFETSGGYTASYQFTESKGQHAIIFRKVLEQTIQTLINTPDIADMQSDFIRVYANIMFNWQTRAQHWNSVLTSLASHPVSVSEKFVYNS